MAAGSVNPFNLSDSEEEAERRPDGAELPLSSSRTSPGAEAISASAAAAAVAATGGSAETRVSPDAIAAQLLRDQYVLTALEFHTELLEAGRELPRLRDYFSNPGNFERQSGTPPACKDQGLGPGGQLHRAGSISTLDSLDFARYSDDGNRESDERVVESEVPSQVRKNFKSSPEVQEPIRSLEKRALNFLVNEYLLKNNYKLSSITFSDENDDQDFELWDDVGLNIPKPPDLLHLYRSCGTRTSSPKDTVDIGVGLEAEERNGVSQQPLQNTELVQSAVVHELEQQMSQLHTEKQSLAEQIRKLQSDIQALKKNVSVPPAAPAELGNLRPDQGPGGAPPENGCCPNVWGTPSRDEVVTRYPTLNSNTDTVPPATLPAHLHAKLKDPTAQGKGPVRFDQPNR